MHGPEFLIPISFFACMFGLGFIYFSTRHRERMAMIEKGASPELFKSKPRGRSTLKFGLLLVGMSLGILTGETLHLNMGLKEEVANFSMIFLFGGLALILSHVLERREDEKALQK